MGYWDKRSLKVIGGRVDFVSDYANAVMSRLVSDVKRLCGQDFKSILKTDLWDEGVAVERKVLGGVVDGGLLVGLDVSRVTCGRVVDGRINVLNGDIRGLPFRGGVFDLVVDNSTVDHVGCKDLGRVFSGYCGVLRRGGVLLVVFALSQPFAVFYQRGVVEGVNFLDGGVVRGWVECCFDVVVDRCHNLLGYFLPFGFWNRLLFHLPVWVRGVFLRVLLLFEFSFLSGWFKRYGGFRVLVGVKR